MADIEMLKAISEKQQTYDLKSTVFSLSGQFIRLARVEAKNSRYQTVKNQIGK